MTDVVPFEQEHAAGVAALCRELGWPSFSDPSTALAACTAPGVTAYVAVEAEPGPTTRTAGTAGTARVVGFAQAFGDGVVQSYLAQLGVASSHRRRGLGRQLVEAVFAATGAQRMDLVTDDAQDFYRSFAHQEKRGFRIYPAS